MEVQENNAVFVVILWQDPYEYNARYAVLVGGGDTTSYSSSNPNGGWFDAFLNDPSEMRDRLKGYGYLDTQQQNNIKCYVWDKTNKDYSWMDGQATNYKIIGAFSDLSKIMTKNDFLFTFFDSHGDRGQFNTYVVQYSGIPSQDFFTFDMIKTCIDGGSFTMIDHTKDPSKSQLVNIICNPILYARSAIIFDQCMKANNGDGAIKTIAEKNANRIIITSCRLGEESYCEAAKPWAPQAQHGAFIYEGYWEGYLVSATWPGFILKMGDINSPQTLWYAYTWGYAAARFNQATSYPQIDDDGNGLPTDLSGSYENGDGPVSWNTYL